MLPLAKNRLLTWQSSVAVIHHTTICPCSPLQGCWAIPVKQYCGVHSSISVEPATVVAVSEYACRWRISSSRDTVDLKEMQGSRVDRVRQPQESPICGSNACVVDLIYEFKQGSYWSYKSAMCMNQNPCSSGWARGGKARRSYHDM